MIETHEVLMSDPQYVREAQSAPWETVYKGHRVEILACNPYHPVSAGLFLGLRVVNKYEGAPPDGRPAPRVFVETDDEGETVRLVIEVQPSD